MPDSNSIFSHRDHCSFQQIVCANLQDAYQELGEVLSSQAFDPNTNYRWSGKSTKGK